MERRKKALYILTIAAIIAYLGMQVYWLYSRYEYSLREHEDAIAQAIGKAFAEYMAKRESKVIMPREMGRVQSSYNLDNGVDSTGNRLRTVKVETKIYDGRKILGIDEDRPLTEAEKGRLAEIMLDSISAIDIRKGEFDVSGAPSDAASWSAMKNFEIEAMHPFTAEGIDTLLRRESIDAQVTLMVTDSMEWRSSQKRHASVFNPHFAVMIPYSELERKSVMIDCEIPGLQILSDMGSTLLLAVGLSLLLIICLMWQILTIVKLTRLDNMRNMFVTTMIHELKRPISTLKMCVSGIENDDMMADREIKAELTLATRTALDNLSAYFSKLRDMTFNDVEQIPLNISEFSLSALVDDVISSVSLPVGKKADFANRVDAGIEVSADRSHIFNIINNLVENSLKYSGASVEIAITATVADGAVSISVSDNGNGVSSAELPEIFARFYRGKDASASGVPGMGLGLAYVKLLVEAHGGEVSARSKAGEGTTITMRLPQ